MDESFDNFSSPIGDDPSPLRDARQPPRRFQMVAIGRAKHPRPFTIASSLTILLSGLLGAIVGHQVWKTPSAIVAPSIGVTRPSSPPDGTGTPSSSRARTLAASAAQALVDINVSNAYQAVGGAGTGMVISSKGEVLTNNHVIEGATALRVTDLGNSRTYNATVVGYDRFRDVALLQLTGATRLRTVALGNSSTVALGNAVVAVGNAGGGGGASYSEGSITGLNRSIVATDELNQTTEHLRGLLETDATIVPGDSGGALVDTSGKVIGMITAGSSEFQFQPAGAKGFAIPINDATAIVAKIKRGSSSSGVHVGPTAFLGIAVQVPTSGSPGAAVAEVFPDGPAARAGLTAGDTITAMGGHPINSPAALTNVLVGERPGSSLEVKFVDASGRNRGVLVTLGSGPPQ